MTLLGKTTGARSATRASGTPARLRSASSRPGRSRSNPLIARRRKTGGHSPVPAPARSLTSTTASSRRRPSRLSSKTTRRTALSLEDRRHRLVAVVLPVGLLAVEPEGLHDRRVLHREED